MEKERFSFPFKFLKLHMADDDVQFAQEDHVLDLNVFVKTGTFMKVQALSEKARLFP